MKVQIKLNDGQMDSMDYLMGDFETERATVDAARMASAIRHDTDLGADIESLSITAKDGNLVEAGKIIGSYEIV